MIINPNWTPKRASQYGANVAVIGAIGSGKTTLLENFAECVYITDKWRPFKIFVHATSDVFKDNWKNLEATIHRKRVTFRSKRFNYLKREYNNSLAFLEDLPAWIHGKDGREIIDTDTLNNFLSTIRHRKTVFFASAQSLADFFSILSPQVLSKFTHYILFKPLESMLRLKKVGLSIGSCHTIERIVQNLPQFHYIMIDLRRKLMTPPIKNLDEPLEVMNMTLNRNNIEDVMEIEVSDRVFNPTPNKKVPLTKTADVIIKRLKEKPEIDLREFAKELGMANQTMYNWIARLKERGYLDSTVRYGAPRK